VTTKAGVKIVNVDVSEAMKMPGVIAYVNALDVKNNEVGLFPGEEQLFATEKSPSVGIPGSFCLCCTVTDDCISCYDSCKITS
jgi:xanthine dehydrogenase molybdopterin-binding subunit B